MRLPNYNNSLTQLFLQLLGSQFGTPTSCLAMYGFLNGQVEHEIDDHMLLASNHITIIPISKPIEPNLGKPTWTSTNPFFAQQKKLSYSVTIRTHVVRCRCCLNNRAAIARRRRTCDAQHKRIANKQKMWRVNWSNRCEVACVSVWVCTLPYCCEQIVSVRYLCKLCEHLASCVHTIVYYEHMVY